MSGGAKSGLSLAPELRNMEVPGVQDDAGPKTVQEQVSVDILCVKNEAEPQTLRMSVAEHGKQGVARVNDKIDVNQISEKE